MAEMAEVRRIQPGLMIGLGAAGALAGGLTLYLLTTRAREAEKAVEEAEELMPTELTDQQLEELVTPGLVEMGEKAGVDYIKNDPDIVTRQAAMLQNDIASAAGRYLEGIYGDEALTNRINWIAETYNVDPSTIRAAVEARIVEVDKGLYGKYASEKKAGTTKDPFYTYVHKEQAASKKERERQVTEFHNTRNKGETFKQWQKRMGYK